MVLWLLQRNLEACLWLGMVEGDSKQALNLLFRVYEEKRVSIISFIAIVAMLVFFSTFLELKQMCELTCDKFTNETGETYIVALHYNGSICSCIPNPYVDRIPLFNSNFTFLNKSCWRFKFWVYFEQTFCRRHKRRLEL